jgi:hypothetical protein
MSEIWSAATPGDKSKYFIQFLDMTNIQKMKESEINTKELVMEYIAAVNRKDFESARSYLNDNVSYRGDLPAWDRLIRLNHTSNIWNTGWLMAYT